MKVHLFLIVYIDLHNIVYNIFAATKGFNLLFNDEIQSASAELSNVNNAFGRTGSGIILFLQAALGNITLFIWYTLAYI